MKLFLPAAVIAVLALLLASTPSSAQESESPALDAGKALIVTFSSHASVEGSDFEEALISALLREAEGIGLAASRSPPIESTVNEIEAVRAASAASGDRWIVVASAEAKDSRVIWRATVYDGSDGSLRGSDSFSAFAGLSVLSLIDDSAKKVMKAALRSIKDEPQSNLIGYSLSFVSRDEGALVAFGEPEGTAIAVSSREKGGSTAGSIAEGKLEAPYLPFMLGDSIILSIEKEGFWPRRFGIKLPESQSPISLPPLFLKTRWAYGGNYGTGRMLGAAAFARWYPVPDVIYIKAEDSFWTAYDFSSGSRPVLHDELRLGAASYLFFDPYAHFRSSVGFGLSAIATLFTVKDMDAPAALDLCAEPIFFTLEWHLPAWAVVFESRFPYSLGVKGGLLPRAWLSLNKSGPLFFSLGVLVKKI